jgi:peptide/nickel transport system substrate-binding protein
MFRKNLLRLLLLVTVIFALSVPSAFAQDGQYNEAPMLAERVAAGELPPVEERLPTNPLVMSTMEIGVYGGTMRRGFTGPSDYNNNTRVAYDALLRWNAAGDTINPHYAESYSSNEDFSVWTVTLREGHKWSDGVPFTSADIMFWYESVALNTDLNPNPPAWLRSSNGNVAVVTAPDAQTIVFTYDAPNTAFPLELANKDGADRTIAPFLPRHYMEQFHPSYADEAALNEAITAGGFTTWTELFISKVFPPDNPARPGLAAWIPVTSLADQVYRLERNPYFVGVDSAGNQLPYIDEVVMTLYNDAQTLNLAAIAGEIDMQNRHLSTANYPVFLENADANGYRVVNLPSFGGAFFVQFNMTFEDDAIRELYNNHDFREALSISINRAAINELVYLGLGEARQPVPAATHPYYPGDESAFAYTQFDPDAANALLDGIGMTERDADGFRLRPDGQPFTAIIEAQQGGQSVDSLELIVNDWQAVGIRTQADLYERSLFFERSNANQHMMSFWNMDTSAFPFSGNPKTNPATASGISDWGRLWTLWYISGGEQGEEPPADIQELEALHALGRTVGPEQQVEIAQQIYRDWAERLYHIGLIGMVPNVFIFNVRLRNIPEFISNDWPLRTPGNAGIETFFYAPE